MIITKDIIDRAMKIDPAMIGHYLDDGFMNPSIKPIDESFKIIGPAYTVRFSGRYSAILYYAMRRAPEGSVIVIDRVGEERFACCGEGVVRVAKSLGLAGIVVDGPSTDTLGIKKIGFPVFSTGRSPVTTVVSRAEGDYNIPVNCGGVVVNSGDIVFGDVDGVIVAKAEEFDMLLEKGEAGAIRERHLFKKIDEGNIRNEPLFPEDKVEALLESRK